ncbi:MAG: helix-hairpin-helix domain-containing protein [Chloroflexota bacterium]
MDDIILLNIYNNPTLILILVWLAIGGGAGYLFSWISASATETTQYVFVGVFSGMLVGAFLISIVFFFTQDWISLLSTSLIMVLLGILTQRAVKRKSENRSSEQDNPVGEEQNGEETDAPFDDLNAFQSDLSPDRDYINNPVQPHEFVESSNDSPDLNESLHHDSEKTGSASNESSSNESSGTSNVKTADEPSTQDGKGSDDELIVGSFSPQNAKNENDVSSSSMEENYAEETQISIDWSPFQPRSTSGINSNGHGTNHVNKSEKEEGEQAGETMAQSQNSASNGNYPDDLTAITGLEDIYAQRLHEMGIFTWAQVAELEPPLLKDWVDAGATTNVKEWPRLARTLATEHNRLDSIYTGPAPERLTQIDGINKSIERTLYQNGIVTLDALANAQMEELSQQLAFTNITSDELQSWIAQAATHNSLSATR